MKKGNGNQIIWGSCLFLFFAVNRLLKSYFQQKTTFCPQSNIYFQDVSKGNKNIDPLPRHPTAIDTRVEEICFVLPMKLTESVIF